MKALITIAIIASIFASCNAQDCKSIKKSFNSYADAKELINKSKFKIHETANTNKSSWIRNASFYSCDGKVGFLIFKTDKQEYIHQDLPIEIWNSFKQAASFGSFYNSKIKSKYQLKLRQ